jgi:DNA-binding MarR family transcriptional regulator
LENLEVYQLAFVANVASQKVTALFEQDFELNVTDWRVLALLINVEYLSFKEILERTGMDKSRVSRAHVRLKKVGLIQVAEGPFDKRTLLMKLTPKGNEILQIVLPKINDFNENLLSVLTEEEKTSLKKILEKIKKQIIF